MSSMPGGDPHQAVGDAERRAPVGRHRGVGHRRRVRDQRFDAAQAFGERHQPDAVQQPAGGFERAELERDHAAEAAHLAPGELVLRVRGEPRIVDVADLGVRGEELRERQTVGVVLHHPERQRLGAAQHQPRVERAEDGALRVLHEPQPLDVVVSHGDDDAADAVAVAVQVFGRAVDDQIGAELDRALDVRARERVVDDEARVVPVRELRRGAQIGERASPGWSASRRTASAWTA